MVQVTATNPDLGKTFHERAHKAEKTQNKYTEAALERHKAEGLHLAVHVRWVALALIAVLVVFINPKWEVIFHLGILASLALNGWVMLRVGRVGHSRIELALIFVDLALMTAGMLMPNPLSADEMPLAMAFRFDNFMYFFVILAFGTLAYSWRTVLAMGVWTAGLWSIGVASIWWFAGPVPDPVEAAQMGVISDPRVVDFMNPYSLNIKLRLQEIAVFVIVAATLGLSVRRYNVLLINNAGLERERANLSRYFSPNVVEELSHNDEPLKQIRTHDVAVLFIDIVDFTSFAARRAPHEVIEVLRGFHARMETQVFRFGGTLDKYLGDGLMATFGTPFAGENDATRALECAQAMAAEIKKWNTERRRAGEPEICAGIGLHYGSVVLGDIGANRLEFAVIGNTVNVANRLEALTRKLKVRVVMSDALRNRVVEETSDKTPSLNGFNRCRDQDIRGVEDKMALWAMK
jgi:adenylate cyclase